jgi:hypothetical protein
MSEGKICSMSSFKPCTCVGLRNFSKALRGDLFVCYVTRAQKTNEHNILLAVVITFKNFIFRYVSQSANKLKKYV